MLFLKDRNQPKGMTDTTKQDLNTTVNEDNIEDETQNVDQDQVATKDASGSWENRNKRFPKSLPDRPGSQKKQKTSATEKALSIMREIQGRNVTVTDQYKSFGDQVGLRIRDLPSSNAQTIVKHLISNILFEAEMGKYDNGNPLSTSQPFYPIPNYIQQQFSVPTAPVYPNTNHHFELPSYSGRMQATSPQSHIQQQFSVPMAPVCPNSNHNFERPSQVTSPQSVVSPTPSAYSLTDSDSVDNLLMEL